MPLAKPSSIIFAFSLCLICAQQSMANLDRKALPSHADSIKKFVPKGWSIESRTDGDLNGDGQPDSVLLLLQGKHGGKDSEFENQSRALVVLLKVADGYDCLGANQKSVLGTQEGGSLGASVEISIAKDILNIKNSGGSRQAWNEWTKFQWDAVKKQLVLIGVERFVGDDATGESVTQSININTHRSILKKFGSNSKGAFNVLKSTKAGKSTMPSKTFDDFSLQTLLDNPLM